MSNPEEDLHAGPEASYTDNLTEEEKLEQLQEAILSCQAQMISMRDERDAFLTQLQRSRADFDNYKKRAKKDKELAAQEVTRNFLKKLIPVMDNIDYALEAVPAEQEILSKPVHMIRDAFLGTLAEFSVLRISPQIGEPFDPEIHQAISVMTADVDSQVVGYVARPGYIIGTQVFRPSDVVVHKPAE
jgi:molecular chaperone GrpE